MRRSTLRHGYLYASSTDSRDRLQGSTTRTARGTACRRYVRRTRIARSIHACADCLDRFESCPDRGSGRTNRRQRSSRPRRTPAGDLNVPICSETSWAIVLAGHAWSPVASAVDFLRRAHLSEAADRCCLKILYPTLSKTPQNPMY